MCALEILCGDSRRLNAQCYNNLVNYITAKNSFVLSTVQTYGTMMCSKSYIYSNFELYLGPKELLIVPSSSTMMYHTALLTWKSYMPTAWILRFVHRLTHLLFQNMVSPRWYYMRQQCPLCTVLSRVANFVNSPHLFCRIPHLRTILSHFGT